MNFQEVARQKSILDPLKNSEISSRRIEEAIEDNAIKSD